MEKRKILQMKKNRFSLQVKLDKINRITQSYSEEERFQRVKQK
jgi:hypothetical protein